MSDRLSVPDQIKKISELAAHGLHREALAASEASFAINPAVPAFGLLKGAMLLELGQFDEAVMAVDRIIAAGHESAPGYVVRGHALWRLGRNMESITSLKRALAINPADTDVQDTLGRFLLSVGDFENGWLQREYRRVLLKPLLCKAPRWKGENIAGKRILVASEEGLGDTVMFVRYFDLLRARGASVTAIVQRPLLRLFQAFDRLTTWTTDVNTTGDFDFQMDLLSLPLIFKTRIETIPSKVPYLAAEPEFVAAWRETIGIQGFKVGIVWETGKSKHADQKRCIPLAAFAPLAAVPGVRLISLQSVNGLDQLSSLPAGMNIERLGNAIELNRFGISEAAAAMQCLDLIVSADTLAAHLAGALGRPVWLGLMHDAEWRWLRERPDSPWYSTMRLFRQNAPGDWPGVFADMAAELISAHAAGQPKTDEGEKPAHLRWRK